MYAARWGAWDCALALVPFSDPLARTECGMGPSEIAGRLGGYADLERRLAAWELNGKEASVLDGVLDPGQKPGCAKKI